MYRTMTNHIFPMWRIWMVSVNGFLHLQRLILARKLSRSFYESWFSLFIKFCWKNMYYCLVAFTGLDESLSFLLFTVFFMIYQVFHGSLLFGYSISKIMLNSLTAIRVWVGMKKSHLLSLLRMNKYDKYKKHKHNHNTNIPTMASFWLL